MRRWWLAGWVAALIWPCVAAGDVFTVGDIRLQGLQRVSAGTVFNLLPVNVGDKFLMCSDGLANFVDDTEMGLAMATLSVDEVPKKMISLANERGGDDNITVLCLAAEP